MRRGGRSRKRETRRLTSILSRWEDGRQNRGKARRSLKARKELREKLDKVRTNGSEFSNFPMKYRTKSLPRTVREWWGVRRKEEGAAM